MKYSKFRNIPISKIGFGTWPLGGDAYGAIDDKESIAALSYAFDNGINFYDTADIYGEGHSELILGKVFRGKRDKVIFSSKCGYVEYKTRAQDFSKHHIGKAIENTLKRLNSDYLDFYFLHSPPLAIIKSADALETLLDLKRQGKIKFIGISIRNPSDGLIALQYEQVDAIQVTFNLLNQEAKECGLFNLAKEKGVCIVNKVPLCYGFLTGKYHMNSLFSNDDHRKFISLEQKEIWLTLAAEIQPLKSLAKTKGITLTQSAIKFCLMEEGISTVIPGMKRVDQVKENIGSLIVEKNDR